MTETASPPLSLGRLLRLGVAMSTAGAGVIHLDAASDHGEHLLVAGFFVAAGLAQIVLAALLCPAVVHPRALAATLVVNGGMVLTWGLSRTVGMSALPVVGSLPGMQVRRRSASRTWRPPASRCPRSCWRCWSRSCLRRPEQRPSPP